MTTFLLIVAAPAALAILLAWRRPDAFRVERGIHADAPPERIVPLIDDLRRFTTRNPFAAGKPMRLDYSGPSAERAPCAA